MVKKSLLLCGVLSLFGAAAAFAFPPIDLTAGQTDVVSTVDGSIWSSNVTQPTGTGTFDPFVRIQTEGSGGTQSGFNTDANPKPLDTKSGIWTHSLTFGDLTTVNIGGTDYYVFQLDANEPNGPTDGTKSLLSLDTIEIYKAGGPAIATYADLVANGTLLYDMDDENLNGVTTAAEDQTVYIETRLKQGSGTDDLTVWIKKSYFGSAAAGDYFYMFSAYGGADALDPGMTAADGFEEWRVKTGNPQVPVPEPGIMVLLGGGLVGLVGTRLRRK